MAKDSRPLKMQKMRLFEGDFERMQTLFPQTGAGPAIRALVRQFLDRVEGSKKPLEIELPSTSQVMELLDND